MVSQFIGNDEVLIKTMLDNLRVYIDFDFQT